MFCHNRANGNGPESKSTHVLRPLRNALSQQGLLGLIKLVIDRRWPTKLTASAFNRLDEYTSSPDNRAYCYVELAVSFLVVAETITSAYPLRDGEAELAWVAGYIPFFGILYHWTFSHHLP